jgi:hypothetical protein
VIVATGQAASPAHRLSEAIERTRSGMHCHQNAGAGEATGARKGGDMGILARHWWAMVLRGLVAVLFGLMPFAWPGLTLAVLVALFGVYAIVDGACAVGAALRIHRLAARWWGLLLEGLLGIAVGSPPWSGRRSAPWCCSGWPVWPRSPSASCCSYSPGRGPWRWSG